MIGLVAYGRGNIRSVENALLRVGAAFRTVDDPRGIADCDKLLLPGVGAFGDCVDTLRAGGFEGPILDHVARDKPLLGICVGMQLLATSGHEFGTHRGLGLIPGRVVQIARTDNSLRLPHVGWNSLAVRKDCPLLRDLPGDRSAYFVHSFHLETDSMDHVSAEVAYGTAITAAVSASHVFGMQFHPEKSQDVGLKILANFAAL
jgi:imidazole glycerol-phosphate synthase subunit HisH